MSYKTKRFGDEYTDDTRDEQELLAQGLSVVGKSFVKTKPADLVTFRTSNVKYGSDDDKTSLVFTAKRSIDHVDLQFIGSMLPNQVVFPITHNALSFDLVYSSMKDVQTLLEDVRMDEYFSILTLFYSSNINEIEYVIRDTKTGFDFNIDSEEHRKQQVYMTYANEFRDLSVKEKDKTKLQAAIKALFKAKYAVMKTKKQFKPVVLRRERVFKAVNEILTCLGNDTELKRLLDKAISFDSPIALFFKLNAASDKLRPYMSYAMAQTSGEIKINQFDKTSTEYNLALATALSTAATEYDAKKDPEKKMADQIAYLDTMMRGAYKTDFKIEVPGFKDLFTDNSTSDEIINTARSQVAKLTERIPDFHKSYEPWSVTADKAEWELRGYNIKARSVSVRIFLYRILVALTKIAYGMLRTQKITMHFPDNKDVSSLEVIDTIYNMKEFDPSKIVKWFHNSANQTYDIKSLRRAYMMFKAFKQLDNQLTTFTNTEELFSQLVEWFPQVYAVNDYISSFDIDEDHHFLYTQLLDDIGRISPAINTIWKTWMKYQPRMDIVTQGGQNVLQELINAGLAYSQEIDFVHFGIFKGGIPLIANSLPFGIPTVQPILLAHFGWNKELNRKQLGQNKYRSVYAQANVGLKTHAFTATYPIVRLKDVFGIDSLADDKRTYRGIYGSAPIDKYSLMTNVNLKDEVYPDQYIGDGSIHFRQGV